VWSWRDESGVAWFWLQLVALPGTPR
jgi:hypothetical protein